jgi:outer membrane protein assembly factor BamB
MRRVTTALVSLGIVVVLGGCDWTQLGFDSGHSGFNPTENAIRVSSVASLQPAWVFRDPNVGESRLAVSGGRVFASAPLGQITGTPPNAVFPPPPLQVLDDKAGTVDWTAGGRVFVSCGDIGVTATSVGAPAVSVGRVYLLSSDTFCVIGGAGEHSYSASSLDAATGAATAFGNIHVLSDPAVSSDGTVFVAESPGAPPFGPSSVVGGSFAFTPPDGYSPGTPAITQDSVYVVTGGGHLYAVDRSTSTLRWSAQIGFGPGPIPTPSVVDGHVYVAGGTVMSAFDAAGVAGCATVGGATTCTPLWNTTLPDMLGTNAPAVAYSHVYARSFNHLYALNAQTGVEAWAATLGSTTGNPAALGSPSVANGVVFVGSQDNQLHAYDGAGTTNCSGTPTTCTPLWTATLAGAPGASQPVIANGSVYISAANPNGGTNSTVYKFSLPTAR